MSDYTSREQMQSFILAAYLDAVEQEKPGIIDQILSEVSGEIDSALGRRYAVPFAPVPESIRYIASVLAAYRVPGSLTSLMDTEASANNEWLPLQTEWKRATALLDDFATGKRKLPPTVKELELDREDASITVVSPAPLFTLRGF